MPLSWGHSAVLIAAFLAAGVVDDLRTRKIHNPLVLTLLALSFFSLLIFPDSSPSLLQSTQSFGLALVLGLAIYFFKVWGGGDAKLFLAVSPLLIPSDVPMFLLWSLVWGAALGLMIALLNGRLIHMLTNLRVAVTHRTGVSEKHLTKVPFSVALLFGHLSVVMLKQKGAL